MQRRSGTAEKGRNGRPLHERCRKYRAYDASDYDAMEKMEILSLQRQGKVCDILHYEAKIRWNCVGYDGAYVDTATYQIGVSCKDDTYRLISIEIL